MLITLFIDSAVEVGTSTTERKFRWDHLGKTNVQKRSTLAQFGSNNADEVDDDGDGEL